MSQSAVISASSSGENTLVAAPGAGLSIRVLHFNFIANGSVNVTFKSGSTAKTGAYPCTAQAGLSTPFAPRSEGIQECLFSCAANEALVLSLSAAVQVSGLVVYEITSG